jgi:hypothetical protein
LQAPSPRQSLRSFPPLCCPKEEILREHQIDDLSPPVRTDGTAPDRANDNIVPVACGPRIVENFLAAVAADIEVIAVIWQAITTFLITFPEAKTPQMLGFENWARSHLWRQQFRCAGFEEALGIAGEGSDRL